jgi:uncharacterized protein
VIARVRTHGGRSTLVGSKCAACGHATFPRREWCPACRSPQAMEETSLSPNATVETSVALYVATDECEAPYTLAIVRLDDGPSLLARLLGSETAGARVRLVADTERDAFWFVPAVDASPIAATAE